jgi:hypothetical protein
MCQHTHLFIQWNLRRKTFPRNGMVKLTEISSAHPTVTVSNAVMMVVEEAVELAVIMHNVHQQELVFLLLNLKRTLS